MGTYYLPGTSGWSEQRNFGSSCKLRLKVVTSYSQLTNKSTLTITLQSYCTAAAGQFVMTDNSQLTVGGTKILDGGGQGGGTLNYEVRYQEDSSWRDVQGTALTTTVTHNASGAASVAFAADFRFKWSGGSAATDYATFYGLTATLSLQESRTYTLTISAGTGASITVKRGSTTLPNGATVTHGDSLMVSFAASNGYTLSTHTVNGASFTSGGTHTVTGAVTVTATASRNASSIASLPASAETLGTISLTMNRAGVNYHKATVTAGGNKLTTTAAFAASVSISVPRSWFSGYPNAASFTATVSVQSYTTSACTTAVGAAVTKTLTITADSGMKPVLQSGYMTLAPYNTDAVSGLTGYVSGYSRATATLNSAKLDMSAAVGASVASIKVTGGGVTATSAPYRTGVLSGTQTVKVTVTDTRGRSASQSLSLETLPYAPPKISGVTVFRCTSNGTKSDEGAYFCVKATLGYSSLDGENSATLTANGTSLTSGTATIIYDGATPDSVIGVEIVARDRLGDSTETRVTRALPGQRWAMRFRPNGRGVAFGMSPAEDETLELPEGWVVKADKLRADSNRNLLTNWEWRDPVNQREQDSYTAIGMSYALDRCRHARGTLTRGVSSVTWQSERDSAYKRIQLLCDTQLYPGVNYTASLLARVQAISGLVSFRKVEDLAGSGGVRVTTGEGWRIFTTSFTQAEASTKPALEILVQNSSNDYLTIEIAAWKLELGERQTLAREYGGVWKLTEQADKTRELLKCQRRYLPLGTYLRYPAVRAATGVVDFLIPLPVQMAGTPTIIGTPELYAGTTLQSGFSFSILEAGANSVLIRATKSGHGLTSERLFLQGNGSALSAE